MRKHHYLLFCVVCTLLISISCEREKPTVLYNTPFTEVATLAKDAKKAFCIVLTQSDACPLCVYLIGTLDKNHQEILKDAIFDFVDISKPEHRWLREWVGITALPLTCVFSSDGKYLARIPGASKICIDCIGESIKGNTDCAYFLSYKAPILEDLQDVNDNLNKVLQCKLRLDQGLDISNSIDSLITKFPYPYTYYLCCKNYMKRGNQQRATEIAEQLLAVDKLIAVRLYAPLMSEIRNELFPQAQTDAPVFTAAKEISLGDCLMEQQKDFVVEVRNTGKSPLVIHDIQVSCTCVSIVDTTPIEIEAGKSRSIKFALIPDEAGKIYREITFLSNAIERLFTVSITANVLK